MKFSLNSVVKLPADFWRYALDGKFTDCEIKAEGRVLKAHRTVLSTCSKYLHDFFKIHKKKIKFQLPRASFKSLRCITELIYCSEVNVEEPEIANQVKSLIKVLEIDARIEEEDDLEDDDEWIPEQIRNHEESFSGVVNSTLYDRDNSTLSDTKTVDSSEGSDEEVLNAIPRQVTANRDRRVSRDFAFSVNGGLNRKRNNYQLRKNRRSIGILLYSCRFCPGLRFESKKGQHNHELTCPWNHNSKEFYKCDDCGKCYLFEARLNSHKTTKHLNVELSDRE